MLTEEQIKKLKKGDPLIVQGLFSEVYADGDILMQIFKKHKDKIEPDFVFCNPFCVSLPSDSQSSTVNSQSEHDPCRLFKKEDKVTPKEVNGRHPGNRGLIFRVCQDEAVSGREIKLTMDGHIGHITIDAAYLELVTPVEELEPYEVTESSDYYGVDKDDLEVEAAIFWKKAHPNAKAAAEAECKRLNAEWRKEHGNES